MLAAMVARIYVEGSGTLTGLNAKYHAYTPVSHEVIYFPDELYLLIVLLPGFAT